MTSKSIHDDSSGKVFTEGANLYIHNETPFTLKKEEQKLYQMECDFPDQIYAKSSYLLRVEFAILCVTGDDRGRGVYYMDTEDGRKYIIFRFDKDSGKFNIWIDFCYSGGTLELKDGQKRQDLGWIHDGTLDFTLYYDDNTRAFSITHPSPLVRDATLRIGYYTLDIGFFEHTYAFMVESSCSVNFQCSGGMNGIDNVFPAHYYEQMTFSKTEYTSHQCNSAVARVLASWEPIVDRSRTNYNRFKKWQEKGVDNAGIAYGVTGVCHQMCNTVLCSIYPEQPFTSQLNCPDSFFLSKLFFGTYGLGANRMPDIRNMIKQAYAYYENKTQANFSRLQDAFHRANEDFIFDLKRQLKGENLAQQRLSLMKEAIDVDKFRALSTDAMNDLIKIDLECAEKKNMLDIKLIKGLISEQQYAAQVNSQVDTLAKIYADLNLIQTNKIHHNLIDPKSIPDYSQLRKILFD